MAIQTMIFDLDGTLVKTEYLKACSYARAIEELCPGAFAEEEVIESFKDLVGLARREVSIALLERYRLEDPARARMAGLGVSTPWEALAQVRLKYYDRMLADAELIRGNVWPHNLALLSFARQVCRKVGLATMSVGSQVDQILAALDLTGAFEYIAGREDVEKPKPDPEIYVLVANKLNTAVENCLVIEDSFVGVQAALAARMNCIAVTTPMTYSAIHAGKILDERWIVDDPAQLTGVVQQLLDGGCGF
jgi:beta-phosphoglucomutase-like phosphatase (HAD superfamily)